VHKEEIASPINQNNKKKLGESKIPQTELNFIIYTSPTNTHARQ